MMHAEVHAFVQLAVAARAQRRDRVAVGMVVYIVELNAIGTWVH